MIVSGRYPEGIAAHSRWLSAAIPPVQQHHSDPIPEGLQPLESLAQSYGWNPSGIQEPVGHEIRWYRYARPPAMNCDPSGVGFWHLTGYPVGGM